MGLSQLICIINSHGIVCRLVLSWGSWCLSGLSHASCFKPATNFVGSTPHLPASCECRVQNRYTGGRIISWTLNRGKRTGINCSGEQPPPTDAGLIHLSPRSRGTIGSPYPDPDDVSSTPNTVLYQPPSPSPPVLSTVLSFHRLFLLSTRNATKNGHPLHHPNPPPGRPPRRRRSLHRARAPSGKSQPFHIS